MTLFLSSEDISDLATDDLVLEAARDAARAAQDDASVLPPRMDVPVGTGFLRVMPAALGQISGLKVMTLAEGLGTRYLILMYRQDDGSLEAVLDAERITQLRTAATTVVAGEILRPKGTSVLGLVGTGFEATGHLSLFASTWPLERVLVYSRSAQRREEFARRMTQSLQVRVDPMESVDDVCAGSDTVVLATKSKVPVVNGKAFCPGAVVLSIGSTRPDLRELDQATLARAVMLMVDDAGQVLAESGDVIDAVGANALGPGHLVAMGRAADAMAERGQLLFDHDTVRDLYAFKSVGTALQDLALARSLVDLARENECGRQLGELTRLKPFARRMP